MARAEGQPGGKEKGFFTKERQGTLLQATGVIVTGLELAALSLVGVAAGIIIFAAGGDVTTKK